MNNTQQLLEYKERINKLEQEESREKGKQQMQSEKLLKDFQCSNIEEAEHKLDNLDKEYSCKETKYNEDLEQLKQLFESQI